MFCCAGFAESGKSEQTRKMSRYLREAAEHVINSATK